MDNHTGYSANKMVMKDSQTEGTDHDLDMPQKINNYKAKILLQADDSIRAQANQSIKSLSILE